MQDLRVIGVEKGALLASSEDGTKFRIPVDEMMQSRLRQSLPEPHSEKKVAPKEIQAHIRSGMSAEDVAAVTGASIAYIQRFEGPILAERDFITGAARAVAVHSADEPDELGATTFGSVIEERLLDLGATEERWTSWKEPGSDWVVKLSFTAKEIDHDARWTFEPRKSTLVPQNNEATALSQQGELTGSLIPRLRAVDASDRTPDTSRFDSGAFSEDELNRRDTAPYLNPVPISGASRKPAQPSAINSDFNDDSAQLGHTADLLEALRRRRGERESAPFEEAEHPSMTEKPSRQPMRAIDIPLDDFEGDEPHDDGDAREPVASSARAPRKGRASMPSWDDIVFGAKSDDD